MKQLAILFVAVCGMTVLASESNAQTGFSYGSFHGHRGFSISVGHGGYYGPGFAHGGWGGCGGYGYYAPVPIYRHVPIHPIYPAPIYGGWGGGCGWGW
jgi:hypothetical protein